MKKSKILAITLGLAIIIGGCGSGASQTTTADQPNKTAETKDTSEKIKIGVIQPRSGDLAVSGEDSFLGTKIAFDLINEAGGVNGKQLEIIAADVPDQTSAQNEVNRLIQNEKVKVITGVYGSAMAEVAGNISNRNDVLYVESISVTDKLTEKGYPGVFRIHTNGSGFGEQAAKIAEHYADKLGKDPKEITVGIVCENGDFGQSVSKGVQSYATQSGMKVVLNELYDSKSTDTSPLVLKMKAANPDVVIATSYINDGIDITKQSRILDFNPKLFIGIGSGYGLPAYEKALGKDAEGMIDIDASKTPIYDSLSPELGAATKEFETRFEKVRGYAPPSTSYLTFQSAWVLAYNIIGEAGGVDDFQKLKDAAMAVDLPEGSLPTGAGVKFNENGQNTRAVLAAMQWQDGKLITIYPDNMASTEPIMIPRPNWTDRK